MSEHVYAEPDLTTKVRYGRGERDQEMEERGEREERIVDIYVTADDLGVSRDPGIQQDNTAQEQNGGSDQSKKNGSRVAAVCLVLLCLLLAVIIGLIIKYSELKTEKNNHVKDLDQLQSRYDNVTKQNNHLQSSFQQLQSKYNNLTVQKHQIQSKYNNLTVQKDQIQSSFDQLQSNYKNVTAERDDLKRRLCESKGFTFDGCVCYYISTEWNTWEDSRQYCRDRQSDLMVINSKEKEDFVERVAVRRQNMWLGLTDKDQEGVWKWVDGTPLTTPTFWHHDEPNNKTYEDDCAVFWSGDNIGWYSKSCDAKNRWICESVMC